MTTPPPIQPPAEKPPKSYWDMTLGEFARNRLAMLGLVIVFFVTTVAVFCPLIANNRPLYLHSVISEDYDRAWLVVLDAKAALDPEAEVARTPPTLRQVRRHLREMRRSLAPEHREAFDNVAAMLTGSMRAGVYDESTRAAIATFERDFDVDVVTLVPRTRLPAFRSLTRAEVFFMFLYLLAIPAWFVRKRFGTAGRFLVATSAPAFVGALLWGVVSPPFHDTFPYRAHIESTRFAEQGWRVLRCPVPYGENENLTAESRQPPTFLLAEDRRAPNQHFHLFGTDTNGRDVLARMVYGARISMLIGIVAVSIYVTIGIVLGAMAGFFGGWIDLGLSRLIEIVICFPTLFLILSVQAFLKPSILNIMVALGLISWTGVARLQRGEFLRLVNQDFVQAVRALGGSSMRIIFRHILPNALGPILVVASFGIAGSILVESTLSFLGFGVPQPTASWGDLLNNGRSDIQGTWWLTLFPGLAIFITVTCFNLVGEGVRDALDPRRQH